MSLMASGIEYQCPSFLWVPFKHAYCSGPTSCEMFISLTPDTVETFIPHMAKKRYSLSKPIYRWIYLLDAWVWVGGTARRDYWRLWPGIIR